MNGTDKDTEIHDKYMREVKTARHLHEMELHSTMPLGNYVEILKVLGGWIYYSKVEKWASFISEKKL